MTAVVYVSQLSLLSYCVQSGRFVSCECRHCLLFANRGLTLWLIFTWKQKQKEILTLLMYCIRKPNLRVDGTLRACSWKQIGMFGRKLILTPLVQHSFVCQRELSEPVCVSILVVSITLPSIVVRCVIVLQYYLCAGYSKVIIFKLSNSEDLCLYVYTALR